MSINLYSQKNIVSIAEKTFIIDTVSLSGYTIHINGYNISHDMIKYSHIKNKTLYIETKTEIITLKLKDGMGGLDTEYFLNYLKLEYIFNK